MYRTYITDYISQELTRIEVELKQQLQQKGIQPGTSVGVLSIAIPEEAELMREFAGQKVTVDVDAMRAELRAQGWSEEQIDRFIKNMTGG